MTVASSTTQGKALDLEAEIERLHHSIDDLTTAISGLKHDVGRQADRLDALGIRQSSDLKDLMTRLHDNYRELVRTQTEAFAGFGDRLEKLVTQQHQQAVEIRSEMRTDFARIVDRQDSHFRWLSGLIVASAIALAAMVFKSLHP